ncbi:protein ref(2)P [Podospora fimiseda]|uniref:Protein ref(2)P n=1 Tax=Podospora fimiseda TaxID=252190 RepID=A0AAN7H0J8_9PEZI|nr:protein ref(2)P [Podospora fimiseda]
MASTPAASSLTRTRIGVITAISLGTAVAGYICYRSYYHPLPGFEPDPARRIRRSNAVRHRRRSAPNIHHSPERQPDSEASYTSAESHVEVDENIQIDNTVRPLADGETVADDHVMDDDWYNDDNNPYGPQQRAGQNIVSLLFRVSEDNARRSAYVHRGCQCNGCGLVPIRGIRYRCANCADFDLCETCESQGLHTKTHIFYKIRIPAPRLGPRQLQPVWYPGDPDNAIRLLPKHLMARLSKETGFERPELEALWEQWTFMANTEWREDPDELYVAMDRKTFERYLVPSGGHRQTTPNLLHDRMFAFYDDNNDDLIGFSEFLRGTSYRRRKDRLRRIFNGYDVDGDGYVSRRDFLRLFRAYYVLFKQMQKDILEGLDDQVMSSAEVQQLVASRQPLSSFFGRDGGFPQGDTDRPLQGKVVNEGIGEVHISDGDHRAVVEDAPDTSDRQSILTDLFMKQSQTTQSLFMPVGDNGHSGHGAATIEYLTALLDPPVQTSQLPALILGETRNGGIMAVLGQPGQGENRRDGNADVVGNGSSPPAEEARQTNGDMFVNGHELHQPSLATSSRRSRANARKKLFDRWKRRQFYLDEEEGAIAPEEWSDDDDILAQVDVSIGNSKAPQQPILSRSRSSSKVRFADDDDDYDVRSNPSTSSRSIPERWGGMEIPDAERDVGKEIFYQVIQQAFNEILDTLFKPKEDLAVQAAETKELREKYRSSFETIDPEDAEKKNVDSNGQPKPPTEKSLQELLAATGYSVEMLPQNEEGSRREETAEERRETSEANGPRDSQELESPISGAVLVEAPSSTHGHRDPTMPQFRPNSDEPADTTEEEDFESKQPTDAPSRTTSSSSSASSSSAAPPPQPEPSAAQPIPLKTLIQWKKLDLAEKEAKERGGWGRLSYEEFERIYKEEEASGSRLDYLGTWIDFCIPNH